MEALGYLLGLAAALGLIGLVGAGAVIAACVYGVRRAVSAIKGEPYVPLLGGGKKRAYAYLDPAGELNADVVLGVLRKYTGVDVVGAYAQAGVAAIAAERQKGSSLMAVLDAKFTPGSLSWEKFSTAATSSHESVVRNCARLANRLQSFDAADYRRLQRMFRPSISALFQRKVAPSATDRERYELHQAALSEMSALLSANDRLLLELDKLIAELNKLTDAGSSKEGDRVVDEIRTLIDETKYYAQ